MSSHGRLSVGHTFSQRPGPSEEERGPTTNSASLARAERTIKDLQEENGRLRAELLETQSLYNQLVKDTSHEKYDERRVNMLKCQIVQLERQVLLLSESLSSRSDVLLEIENHLTYLADICRQHLDNKTQIGAISFSSADVTKMLETAESGRLKLFKNIENSKLERQTRPVILLDQFIKTQTSQPITMLDVCSGSLEHINIKKVGKLESKLSKLYKQLLALNNCISFVLPGSHQKSTNHNIPEAVYARLGCQVIKSCDQLKECTQDLLALSVLLPTAPWPSLHRPVLDEITLDTVMSSLPALPRSKHADVQQTLDALLKAINYQQMTTRIEVSLMKEELQFHEQIYELQINYVDSMFQALKDGYQKFEMEMNTIICKPLQDILKQYEKLKSTSGEDGLRELLISLKDNADQLQSIVDKLAVKSEESEGHEALSEFSSQFFSTLEKQKHECARKRDSLADNLEEVKQQKDTYAAECKALLQHKKEQKKETTDIVSPSSDVEKKNITRSDNQENNGGIPDAKARTKIIKKTLKSTSDTIHADPSSKTSKLAQPKVYSASPITDKRKQVTASPATKSAYHRASPLKSGSSDNDSGEGRSGSGDKSRSSSYRSPSYVHRSGSLTKLSLKPSAKKESPSD